LTSHFGILKFCLDVNSDDPITLHSRTNDNRDPKDYEFLLAAMQNLESDFEKASKLLTKLKETQNNFEIKACFEGLQYFCEDLDVSQGIIKLKGIELVVSFIDHDDEEIRFISAWVLASILQSNLETQKYAEKINLLEKLVKAMRNENNPSVMGKLLYALSSFLSDNIELMKLFIDQYDGIQLLNRYLSQKATDECVPIKAKTIWILSKFINIPSFQTSLIELGTLKLIYKSLDEDKTHNSIRRNILSFFASLFHKQDLSRDVINCLKENNIAVIDESICDENELLYLRSIQRTKEKMSLTL